MCDFESRKFQFFASKFVTMRNIDGSQIFEKQKYEFSASFCTSKQLHSLETRKFRFGQSWRISRFCTQFFLLDDLSSLCAKSWNPPTLTETSFASFRTLKLIRRALKLSTLKPPYFSDFKHFQTEISEFLPVEISAEKNPDWAQISR